MQLSPLRQLQIEVARCRPTPVRHLRRKHLESLLKTFGITRVAEITGLDFLGVPNWSAVRPNSRGIVVSSGKGIDDEAAWVSAVMESIEEAHAEAARKLISFLDTTTGMRNRGVDLVPFAGQYRCDSERISHEQKLAWVSGISLRSGSEVYAPYELIGLDLASNSPWDTDNFRMSSVGIGASGNLAGAVLQGLFELLEDDALFTASALTKRPNLQKSNNIVIACSTSHPLPKLCAKIRDKGIAPEFARLPSTFSYPTFVATLRPEEKEVLGAMQFQGYACRGTDADAALAALLEAVQTRLTFISGAREDLYQEEYNQILHEFWFGNYKQPCFSDIGCEGTPRNDHLVREILEEMFSSGISDVYAFSLGGLEGVYDVVRILGDDLNTPDRIVHKTLQGRAKEAFLGNTILS